MASRGVELVRQARCYVGTRFAPGGRSEFGMDCAGLILRVAEDVGLATPAVPNYHAAFDSGCVAAYLEPFCDRVDLYEPVTFYLGRHLQPGDFLLFSLAKGVQHLGIATAEGTFIHAWDSPSVKNVVETPLDGWWQRRLRSVWRFRGLPDG